MPAVDRERQRAAYPYVVERLFLVVRRHKCPAIPIAGLYGDLVAERVDELVAGCRRQPPELDRRTIAADRLDPNRLLIGVDAGEPVEIREPPVIIVGVLDPLDRLSGLVRSELERTGAHNVLLVPAGILVEDRFLVDPVIGVGEGGEKCAGGELQPEDHGCRIGCLDLVDHHEKALTRAGHPFGWVDDLLPTRHHVGGRK